MTQMCSVQCTVYCVYCDPRGILHYSVFNAWLVGRFSSLQFFLTHWFSQNGILHIFNIKVETNIYLHLNTKCYLR